MAKAEVSLSNSGAQIKLPKCLKILEALLGFGVCLSNKCEPLSPNLSNTLVKIFFFLFVFLASYSEPRDFSVNFLLISFTAAFSTFTSRSGLTKPTSTSGKADLVVFDTSGLEPRITSLIDAAVVSEAILEVDVKLAELEIPFFNSA